MLKNSYSPFNSGLLESPNRPKLAPTKAPVVPKAPVVESPGVVESLLVGVASPILSLAPTFSLIVVALITCCKSGSIAQDLAELPTDPAVTMLLSSALPVWDALPAAINDMRLKIPELEIIKPLPIEVPSITPELVSVTDSLGWTILPIIIEMLMLSPPMLLCDLVCLKGFDLSSVDDLGNPIGNTVSDPLGAVELMAFNFYPAVGCSVLDAAADEFIGSIISVASEVTAMAFEGLEGISTLDLHFVAEADINAIVTEANFLDSYSLNGVATALTGVSAIALEGVSIDLDPSLTLVWPTT